MINYDSVGYARTRLEGVILLHKELNRLFLVYEVKGRVPNILLNVGPLGDNAPKLKDFPISDFHLGVPELGNMNRGEKAIWTFRPPSRRDYRQGFRLDMLRYFYMAMPGIVQTYTGLRGNLTEPILKNIRGDFPDYYEAQDMVQDSFDSIAIGRKFALNRNGHLLYNSIVVGDATNKHPTLFNSFVELKETLDEELAGNHKLVMEAL